MEYKKSWHDMKNIDVMNSQHTKVQWHIIIMACHEFIILKKIHGG
jgi:mannosyltransferase OCH1-like enzyme